MSESLKTGIELDSLILEKWCFTFTIESGSSADHLKQSLMVKLPQDPLFTNL